jgi:hypothetical protein
MHVTVHIVLSVCFITLRLQPLLFFWRRDCERRLAIFAAKSVNLQMLAPALLARICMVRCRHVRRFDFKARKGVIRLHRYSDVSELSNVRPAVPCMRRILVADDDPMVCMAIEKFFSVKVFRLLLLTAATPAFALLHLGGNKTRDDSRLCIPSKIVASVYHNGKAPLCDVFWSSMMIDMFAV